MARRYRVCSPRALTSVMCMVWDMPAALPWHSPTQCRPRGPLDSERLPMAEEEVAELPQPGFTRELFRLDGKVALIRGGRGALAQAMTATLADLGCDVALASRHEADCSQLATAVAGRFGRRAIG